MFILLFFALKIRGFAPIITVCSQNLCKLWVTDKRAVGGEGISSKVKGGRWQG